MMVTMAGSPETQKAVALYQQVLALRPADLNPNSAAGIHFDQLIAELRRQAAELTLRDQGV